MTVAGSIDPARLLEEQTASRQRQPRTASLQPCACVVPSPLPLRSTQSVEVLEGERMSFRYRLDHCEAA